MDLARAPCRAPLTARKKGSGYENGPNTDPTSYPGSFHYAPRWRKDPGPGWSRVSQILGDNNWDLWGVGKANVAFELKTIQGV